MSDQDTVDRLGLPCPCCDERGMLAAYVYAERVAVSCIACTHVWTERAYLHGLVRRAAHHQSCWGDPQSWPLRSWGCR